MKERIGNLIVRRFAGQTVEIDGGASAGGATVTLLAIKGRRAVLSVEAPASVHVRRGEIAPLAKQDEE